MRYVALRAAALAVCLTMASCANSNKPGLALPKPLPAAYAQHCPSPPESPQTPEVDAMAVALKELYDLYGICAGRMADLLDWLSQERQ